MGRVQIIHIYRIPWVKVEKSQDKEDVLSKVSITSLIQGQQELKSIHKEKGFQLITSKDQTISNLHLMATIIQCHHKELLVGIIREWEVTHFKMRVHKVGLRMEVSF